MLIAMVDNVYGNKSCGFWLFGMPSNFAFIFILYGVKRIE